MMRKKAKKEEGFTLIEVLITVGIMVGSLIALLSCFIYGFEIISTMKQKTIATRSIQKELEEVRDLTYEEVLALSSSFTHEGFKDLNNLVGCSEASGTRTVEDTGIGDDIRRLTITVQWTYRGRTMQKDVATFITREGINKK